MTRKLPLHFRPATKTQFIVAQQHLIITLGCRWTSSGKVILTNTYYRDITIRSGKELYSDDNYNKYEEVTMQELLAITKLVG